ncbi:MAG: hypothetical protein IJY62_02950 [Clostridia bacterium]|nr:hypothetical protein [Clostridia bacterium]
MSDQMKEKVKKTPPFKALFFVLLSLFFLVGLIFGGSFRSTGKYFYNSAASGHAAVFDLNANSDQKLKTVYVNVGSVYAPVGSDLSLTVKRYSSKTSSTSYTFASAKVGVIYSESGKGKNGALFNWVELTSDTARVVASISITTDFNAEINEIVCFDEGGRQIPLSVNTTNSKGYKSPAKALAGGVDKQNSFTASLSARSNFTEEEAYTLSAIRNVLGGSSFEDGNKYVVDKNFNSLGTLLTMPFVAVFGASTAALRLPSLLAASAAILFLWLFASLLFKNETWAFFAALLFAFGGLAFSVATLGAPYAIVASALLGSLYFMQRFFAKGVPSAHIYKGASNVLYSGLFAAVALCVDLSAVFPVAGILALFAFGLRRMKLAYANETEKIAASSVSEEKKQEAEKTAKATYRLKMRVTCSFAAISFAIVSFVLVLLSSVITYSAYVKAYDNPVTPTLGYGTLLWKGLSSGFVRGNATSFTEASSSLALSWLLPLKPATLYSLVATGAGADYIAKNAFMSPVVTLVGLLSLVYLLVQTLLTLLKKDASKEGKRLVRSLAVIGGGLVTLLIKGLAAKNVSVLDGFAFSALWLTLIPLALKTFGEKKKQEKLSVVLGWTVAALSLVLLCLSAPTLFGFPIKSGAAKLLFGWMNFINNGFFRI